MDNNLLKIVINTTNQLNTFMCFQLIMPKTKLLVSHNCLLFLSVQTTGFPDRKLGQYDGYYDYKELEHYNSSRIVSIAWTIYDINGKFYKAKDFLIKPDGFTIDNSFVHNITTEHATSNGVPIKDALKVLENNLKRVKFLVAHGVGFGYNILCSEAYRAGRLNLCQKLEQLEQTCTAEQTRDEMKIPLSNSTRYKTPKFTELYEHCFGTQLENHHDAKSDAYHLAECFFHLLGTPIQAQ